MSFVADIFDSIFGVKKADPIAAAAQIQKAADAAASTSTVDQQQLDAAVRQKQRYSKTNLIIDPGIAGTQGGTGLNIPL